jgi:stearoyl-CoA desaturase (delta-9 desaturase)
VPAFRRLIRPGARRGTGSYGRLGATPAGQDEVTSFRLAQVNIARRLDGGDWIGLAGRARWAPGRRMLPLYVCSRSMHEFGAGPDHAGLEVRRAASLAIARRTLAAGHERVPYDGISSFPDSTAPAPSGAQRAVALTVTGLIVAGPFAGLIAAVVLLWGHAVGAADLVLLGFFYLVTGFGVTVGFHRGLTHGSFRARPALRVALAVAGSMSFQGNVTGWVATHRRHHAFTDQPGDPHSPYRYGTGPAGQLRGVLHAHVGWLFGNDPTSQERYAPDLVADPAMRRVSAAFPVLCAVSLGLPFAAGWALGGLRTALLALLWGGLVRVFLLQHVTWSVNSLCHLLGSRPFVTRRHDRATNLWPLAVLSLGDSWHNMHHSDPACARHGVDRGQLDLSALLIRGLERAGWATGVHWPTAARLRQHRRPAGRVLTRKAAP